MILESQPERCAVRTLKLLTISLSIVCFSMAEGWAASSPSGNVTIQAKVPLDCNILIENKSGILIDDLSEGASDLLVAEVTEVCNDPDGYVVSVESARTGLHKGEFLEPTLNAKHEFDIYYNGSLVVVDKIAREETGVTTGTVSPVTITYLEDRTLPATAAHTYVETLKFTIAPK